MTDLEKEYQETIEKINGRLKEAAASLIEATKLARDKNIWLADQTLEDDDELEIYHTSSIEEIENIEDIIDTINVHPLMNALNAAGWSSSSMSC